MPNIANITLAGHLGKDPELTQVGEHQVCRFSVAHTRKRKAGDVTTWYAVTAWRQSAEYASKYLKKGDAVIVIGEVYLEEYTGKDGTKQRQLKVEAQSVSSLSGPRGEQAPTPAPRTTAPTSGGGASDIDNPPF
jgi:single-strand DNA-binding protein